MKYYQLFFITIVLAGTGCARRNETRPQRKEIIDAVFGSGHIENENQYTLMANADGYVKAAYVIEGDQIKPGQQLFRLNNDVQQTQVNNALTNLKFAQTNVSANSPQIDQLKIQIAQAKDKLNVDSTNYARYSRLVKTNAVSKTDFENAGLQYQSSLSSLNVLKKNLADLQHNLNLSADNAKAQYQIQKQNNDYYNITGVTPGIIISISKKVGDYVKKGEVIALVGAGRPVAKLYIAEDDIQRIRVGQKALISLNSNKDKVYNATITKIYPSFNTDQQAFTADAYFNEPPATLINGTQLQANVVIEDKKGALVIPSYYLINGDYVFTKNNKGKIPVKVGIRTLEWTEILGGITENDTVIQPKQN